MNQGQWLKDAYDEWVGRTTGARSNMAQARGAEAAARERERAKRSWPEPVSAPHCHDSGIPSPKSDAAPAGSRSNSGGGLALLVIIGLAFAFLGSDQQKPQATGPTPATEVPPVIAPPVATETQQASPSAPAEEAAPEADNEFPLPATTVPAVLRAIDRPVPSFPELARRARIWGTVRLRAVVRPDGTVHHVEELSGNPVLLSAAAEALAQWRFEPFLSAEESMASTDVEFHFQPN
jgi:TonB family protein